MGYEQTRCGEVWNELTREFTVAKVWIKCLESTNGEVDRVSVLAGGAIISDSDGCCPIVVQVGDLDLETTEG